MQKQKHFSSGFTLIEFIIVIVVIAILAAIAIPKYIALTNEAKQATIESYAGAIASASSINYAVCKANPKNSRCISNLKSCTDFKNLLADGNKMPSAISIATIGEFPITSGEVADCEMTYGNQNRIEFRVIVP